jgi:inhibitor of KinA
MNIEIHPVGEEHVILLLSYYDTSKCVSIINQLQRQLNIPGIRSIRPGLDCLLLELEETVDRQDLKRTLHNIEIKEVSETPKDIIKIPVCYELGIDLEKVSKTVGLSKEEVIRLHSSSTYTVWMIGFMPGYPYMGELPKALHIPRKSNPDQKLAAGSVAIAEEFVGVYPFDSPGGWHVLGRTPIRLFDYQRDRPSIFNYGMKVQFYSITKDEFDLLLGGRASVPADAQAGRDARSPD